MTTVRAYHPNIIPHIFDPFFTTKPPGKGDRAWFGGIPRYHQPPRRQNSRGKRTGKGNNFYGHFAGDHRLTGDYNLLGSAGPFNCFEKRMHFSVDIQNFPKLAVLQRCKAKITAFEGFKYFIGNRFTGQGQVQLPGKG